METPKIYIGTSGWHYKHWLGTFYPEGTKASQQLSLYQQHFDTVEINASFYKLPKPETFAAWKAAVPENFIYAVKGSRFITHMKKLKDPVQSSQLFFNNLKYLEEKAGPVLFQLPPFWELNYQRLEEFIQHLPAGYLYTFEFRNPTWYTPEVYGLLRAHNCAFCLYELDSHISPEEITASFIYIRLHGPGGKYQGSYSDEVLKNWADKCLEWNEKGKQVFIYFDNDQNGYAAFNAKKLREFVFSKKEEVASATSSKLTL